MASVGAALGTFDDIPLFPYLDGQRGWYFEIYRKGDDHTKILEDVIDEVQEKLDKCSLQIMKEIFITQIIIFNISEIFEKKEGQLVKISKEKLQSFEQIKDQNYLQQLFHYPFGFSGQRGAWLMTPYQINVRGTIAQSITDTNLNEKDAKALRWFVKALSASNEVDRFTSYVTALDILSHKSSLEETEPLCTKCKKPIDYIHDCGEKMLKQAYAKDYLIEFGLTEPQADKINKLRNKTLHGRSHLQLSDMEEFLDANTFLVFELVKHFKQTMNISASMPPILNPAVIMIDKFCEIHERNITQEIFDEMKSNFS
ncbi:MAG TPA: hypothetical protein VNK25_00270 [Candidatus Nitrosotenuis sp.]|jgi:hypothetical protein|nr:hypothetical protein [Candidatus Nitrosotenuis sp.]